MNFWQENATQSLNKNRGKKRKNIIEKSFTSYFCGVFLSAFYLLFFFIDVVLAKLVNLGAKRLITSCIRLWHKVNLNESSGKFKTDVDMQDFQSHNKWETPVPPNK